MINIIAAIGKNRELGKSNKLLWHIKEDMIRFKNLTTGQVVIMGRKTFESLPDKFRPLPNRINIVVTKKSNEIRRSNETYWANSIEEAIKKAKEFNKEIFIIGGASIYEQSIKYADKLYLTLIDELFPDADVYFPDFSEFNKMLFEEKHSEGELHFKFVDLAK